MPTKSLRIKSYRSWTINDTSNEATIERLKKLELYTRLKTESCISPALKSSAGLKPPISAG